MHLEQQSSFIRAQLFHSNDKCVNGRGVHEIEVYDVVDTHSFEGQYDIAKICPLDFGDGCREHLVFEGVFSV